MVKIKSGVQYQPVQDMGSLSLRLVMLWKVFLKVTKRSMLRANTASREREEMMRNSHSIQESRLGFLNYKFNDKVSNQTNVT